MPLAMTLLSADGEVVDKGQFVRLTPAMDTKPGSGASSSPAATRSAEMMASDLFFAHGPKSASPANPACAHRAPAVDPDLAQDIADAESVLFIDCSLDRRRAASDFAKSAGLRSRRHVHPSLSALPSCFAWRRISMTHAAKSLLLTIGAGSIELGEELQRAGAAPSSRRAGTCSNSPFASLLR